MNIKLNCFKEGIDPIFSDWSLIVVEGEVGWRQANSKMSAECSSSDEGRALSEGRSTLVVSEKRKFTVSNSVCLLVMASF